MLCTAAEIEEKKRQAKEKLLQKRRQNSGNFNNGAGISRTTSANVCPSKDAHNTSPKPVYFPKSNTTPSSSSNFNNSPKQEKQTYQSFRNNGNKSVQSFKVFSNDAKIQATCILMPANRFQVKLSKFFNVAIEVMKTIPSKSYDPKTCRWSFSLDHYDLLLSKFQTLSSQLQVNKLPVWIHNLKKKYVENCYDFSGIDDDLRNTLMPFQEESLCFAIERNGRCFIADEMGLGKTIQALAIAAYYREDWPLLIVTTASTCSNWETTISKYLPSIPLMNIQLLGAKEDYIDKPSVIITSYDMMTRRSDELLASKCGFCIFDESHTLKNFKTKWFKSAQSLSKKAKRVLLLSGTPAFSKPSELFTQLQLIDESFFINFMEYSKRYCDGKESNFGWDASGQSNLDELQIVLEHRFMIRRTKDTLNALDIPDKVQEIVHLNITKADLNIEAKKELETMHGTDFQKVIKNVQQILAFFHTTAQIKVPAVCAYVHELLAKETKKIIIFAHHMVMMDAVEKVLKDNSKKYIRIDGKTTNREKLVRLFQTNENIVCALLSITSANAGITLTAAEIVIFAELHWTPSILAQAEARAHRIGQTKTVTVRYLIGAKTVDDYIWPLLKSKQQTLNEMKLTTDSFENFKTVKSKEIPKNSTITHYFSPKSDTKRSRLHQDIDKQEPTTKKNKMEPSTSSSSLTEQAKSRICDELLQDEEIDDFFYNFSTQQIVPSKENTETITNHNDENDDDLFNDDMDEILRSIPL